MSERRYVLSIERHDPNPKYVPDVRDRYMTGERDPEYIQVREVSATITEAEFDIIKQALLKVWK